MLIADNNPSSILQLTVALEESYINYDIVTNGVKLVEMLIKDKEKECCDIHYKIIMIDMDLLTFSNEEALKIF